MATELKLSKDGSIHVTDEKINTISHLSASCLSLLGVALLVAQASSKGQPWKIVGLSVYGLSLISLFIFSTLHHGVNGSHKVNHVLRTFDYVSVFVLIAGTVTPLVLVRYRNTYGWAVFGAVWAIAIIGITLRAAYANLPRYIINTLYIVLGWLPVSLIADKPHLSLPALLLLGSGGLFYSLGFAIYVIEKPNWLPGRFGFHELWHLLVIIAAILQYLLMYLYILK